MANTPTLPPPSLSSLVHIRTDIKLKNTRVTVALHHWQRCDFDMILKWINYEISKTIVFIFNTDSQCHCVFLCICHTYFCIFKAYGLLYKISKWHFAYCLKMTHSTVHIFLIGCEICGKLWVLWMSMWSILQISGASCI